MAYDLVNIQLNYIWFRPSQLINYLNLTFPDNRNLFFILEFIDVSQASADTRIAISYSFLISPTYPYYIYLGQGEYNYFDYQLSTGYIVKYKILADVEQSILSEGKTYRFVSEFSIYLNVNRIDSRIQSNVNLRNIFPLRDIVPKLIIDNASIQKSTI